MEGKASSLFLVSWVRAWQDWWSTEESEQERGGKSVTSLLAIFFFLPSCDFPERIKLNNTQYKHFLFKDPCCLSLWCQSFNCNYNLPIRQTPFSVTVRDGSDCVHLPTYSLYPGQANISYILLQNEVSHVHEKQEVGSARRMTCLARSYFLWQ